MISTTLSMTRLPGYLLVGILSAAALVQAYAGLELLGLRWDGGPFLRDMLSAHTFVFYEQARETTQFILELPVVVSMRLGLSDLYWLSAIWSLTLQLAPCILTCACYFVLPPSHKIFFLLPTFHYFAGAASVATAGLIEGPTAAAYFWIVFYALLFLREYWIARVAFLLLAIPILFLHEVMAILGPILVYAAWWRGRQATNLSWRLFFRAFAIFFLLVTIVQIGFVIVPKSVANRNGFVAQMLGFQWLFTTARLINVPAALGLLAGLTALALWRFPRCAWWLVSGFGIAAVILVETALAYGLADQFYARDIPALIIPPLSIAALGALRTPETANRLWSADHGRTLVVLAVLACGTLLIQVASAREWATYVTTYRDALRNRTGLIAWEELMNELPRDQARLLERTNFPFANPDMSLLLARDRHVQSIVMNPHTTIWGGWRPTAPSEWPKGWFYERILPTVERGTP
jgi:hypothetical protein